MIMKPILVYETTIRKQMKPSRSTYLREWRKKNPEKVRKYKKNYYKKHSEHESMKARQRYYKQCDWKYELQQHYCHRCDSFVYWDHEHFNYPMHRRYNHRRLLPKYKELINQWKEEFYRYLSKKDLR